MALEIELTWELNRRLLYWWRVLYFWATSRYCTII